MSRSPEQKWADCLSFIRNNIGESQFNIWFAPISFHSYGDGLLRLKVPSMSFIEFIEAHFVKLIRTTIAKFYGSGTQLKYLVDIDTGDIPRDRRGFRAGRSGKVPVADCRRARAEHDMCRVSAPFAGAFTGRIHVE